jgi:SAM-dependent methyltransferase
VIFRVKMPEQVKERIRPFLTPSTPKHIAANFRELDARGVSGIEAALRQRYYAGDDRYLASSEGRKDLRDHVLGRLNNFRRTVIPWLDDARPLDGAHILEIGCGTGSSTVALAEQKAIVTSVDVNEAHMSVARERCDMYGLRSDLHCISATQVHEAFADRQFDIVVFTASLEHMFHQERIDAMIGTWGMLRKNDIWCVVDAPNRLWFYDDHTSWLPFFHWLPDDLAFAYSRFSPRPSLSSQFLDPSDESRNDFLRKGRGVSFHEFELALGGLQNVDIVSSLSGFLRSRNLVRRLTWRITESGRYESFLRSVRPGLDSGFFHQSLDLIIRKG